MLALALAMSGCVHRFDAATLGVEAIMSSPAANLPQGEPFKIDRKAVYLVLGVIPVARPSLQKVLATQVVGDQRIANLKITVKSRWTDVLLTAITAGLVVPRTVVYEGIVIGR
ncbi:MAG: hypothetical protein ACE5PT_06480 [Gemmatimonadales bacterium]